MAIVRMVRHGEAAAGYSEHPDPGLSEKGKLQAEGVADALGSLPVAAVFSSPMARAQETAAPLAKLWATDVKIAPAVSEIPSPGLAPHERGPWLQKVMAGTWDEAPEHVREWRDGIAEFLQSLETDAVVFSHYVAINAALAVATGSDSPRVAHLDHCSITTFDNGGGELRAIEIGQQGDTVIL